MFFLINPVYLSIYLSIYLVRVVAVVDVVAVVAVVRIVVVVDVVRVVAVVDAVAVASKTTEARTAPTVWNWSVKTLSPGALTLLLDFSWPEFFSRPFRLFPAPTNCLLVNLVPSAHVSLGQRQDTWALGMRLCRGCAEPTSSPGVSFVMRWKYRDPWPGPTTFRF